MGDQQISDVLFIELGISVLLSYRITALSSVSLIVAFQIQVAVKSISNNLFLSERLCLKIDRS